MPKVQLPIANGFYQSESLPISAQQCINWYPNIVQTQGLSQETLFGIPGIRQLVTTGIVDEINRGMHVKSDILYFVNGNTLFSLDRTLGPESFSFTALGTIDGTGPVSMADNGTQLMILSPGGNGYIFDESSGSPFLQITDAGFTSNGNPLTVVFIDGLFVCNTDTKKIIQSNTNDGLNWDPLDAGTAESDPDSIVSMFVFQNKLFALGAETTESFDNVATLGFVFQRAYILPKGIFARFSVVSTTNSFVFIGGAVNESPAVWSFTGNGFDKISTTAIDNLLNDLTDSELNDIIAVTYAEKGAYFTGFSLPDTDIYYDAISNRWHERNTFNNGQLTGWRVGFMASAYGRIVVGDAIDGRIGELDSDLFTEYDDTIFRRFITQPFANLGNAIFVPGIELTMEAGVGDFNIRDPKIRMRYSDDAKTFSDELVRNIGRQGEYFRRTIWRRIGRVPRFRFFEFTLTDPVRPPVIKLEANLKGSTRG